MSDYMTKKEAEREFKLFYLPVIPPRDKPAIREAWNDYTDSLQKNGRISLRQYLTWSHPKFIKKLGR